MTLMELEIRVATLEERLAQLAGKVDAPSSANINAWIDQVHGTFRNDANYRKAALLGQQWRKSHRSSRKSGARKVARA
jgi:hypothetical protein